MGGQGSGPRPGDRLGAWYMTERRRRELRAWEAEDARAAEIRKGRSKERHRIRSRERMRSLRAERRAAGIAPRKHKPEVSGASSARVQRHREKCRLERIEALKAARKARRMARRLAKGLPAEPKTDAQMVAECRERKAIERAEYLASFWFSPALPTDTVKEMIQRQYLKMDETEVNSHYSWIAAQARHVNVNLNAFTIVFDGIRKAEDTRAVFNEVYQQVGNCNDMQGLFIEAEKQESIRSVLLAQYSRILTDETRIQNQIIKARDYGKTMWGAGSLIYEAVSKGEK